ncbi:hypothetical protein H6F32_04690 [Anabaena sp. FACHB-1237]|uniref:hypothetical protein n=1 Tax=Anabaena sp. FACHB-1237 TaxID=2692769 RepID=UPI001680E038|nr:hypothetical protein [Anabaena sp. FACHB-1237]MBD2136900.1 hypothetical protein [Anabaena sp. FACHB-1237]
MLRDAHIPVIDTFLNDRNFYTLVDGGLFANNPTSLAMMEALISSQEPGKTPLQLNEILIVSLGTGSLIRKYAYEDAKKWGLLKWVQPLINIVLDSGSESVTCQLEQLLPDIPGPNKQYYRFQGLLKGANDDMDDATPKNIENLLKLTDKIIQENGAAIDQLVEVLSQ